MGVLTYIAKGWDKGTECLLDASKLDPKKLDDVYWYPDEIPTNLWTFMKRIDGTKYLGYITDHEIHVFEHVASALHSPSPCTIIHILGNDDGDYMKLVWTVTDTGGSVKVFTYTLDFDELPFKPYEFWDETSTDS